MAFSGGKIAQPLHITRHAHRQKTVETIRLSTKGTDSRWLRKTLQHLDSASKQDATGLIYSNRVPGSKPGVSPAGVRADLRPQCQSTNASRKTVGEKRRNRHSGSEAITVQHEGMIGKAQEARS
jgi:hypothetical protein